MDPTAPNTATGAAAAQAPAGRLPDEWCTRSFDHLSPELAATLPETLTRMRSLCPVTHSDKHEGFWVLTKYDDVLRVAQDWQSFTSTQGLNIPPSTTHVRNIPVEVDPPEQRAYKKLINTHFTPAAIASWAEPTRELVTRLIDGFIDRGECEFMDDFARPFPSLSFFTFALDAPVEDLEKVAYLASKSSIPNDPQGKECWAGLSEWITGFVESRRRRPPRGDVVDALFTAEIGERPLTEREIIGIVQLLILGGLETTAGALGLMMARFCREPEIPAYLRAHPERIPAAVEELLRLDAPFIAIARTATADVQLRDQQISAGDKVLMYWASANHDDDEFTNPDTFDLERATNRHLAFGAGPHRCLGSNVARLNMRIALEELLRRMVDFRLRDDAEIHYHTTLTRAPLTLPITFTAAA
ncbi:cytochrome P450 [Frankia sp. R43]|uniref:cytochrome P450 n=1 Tax=Frankia sp. R43 TaxID=269536 RepID=UPI0006CA5E2E|nr:cytochrome P450 [Frankia sp. R43]KPM51072.1 cytochrome P450 [Frankia sp. R43]